MIKVIVFLLCVRPFVYTCLFKSVKGNHEIFFYFTVCLQEYSSGCQGNLGGIPHVQCHSAECFQSSTYSMFDNALRNVCLSDFTCYFVNVKYKYKNHIHPPKNYQIFSKYGAA